MGVRLQLALLALLGLFARLVHGGAGGIVQLEHLEMLALRVLTMTDREKGEMATVDAKAGALLARVEGMAREYLLSLHGTLRDVRPTTGEDVHEQLGPAR